MAPRPSPWLSYRAVPFTGAGEKLSARRCSASLVLFRIPSLFPAAAHLEEVGEGSPRLQVAREPVLLNCFKIRPHLRGSKATSHGRQLRRLGWGEKHNQVLNFLSRPISRQSFFLTEILRKFTSRLALGVSHTGPLTRVGGKAGVMGRKVL